MSSCGPARWDPDTLAQHNAEVKTLWADFEAGCPERVPVAFNLGWRYYLLTPWLNTQGISFQRYFEDPAVQWEVQLTFWKWIREHVPADQEWGLPEQWNGLRPDLQNTYEAAWLGCRMEYREGEVPDTWPLLKEDKGRLASLSIPDPLRGGIMGRAMEYYQYFEERRKREDFCGRPIGKSALSGGGTDGPFTAACNLRGAMELCLDLYEDPQYVRELLDFITEAILLRIRAVAEFNGVAYPQQGWGFADDSIQLLSVEQYREFVLPCHRRLLAAFSQGGPNSIHLCGNVQRHLPILQQELNIQDYDLGFPVDLGQVRRDLGPGALLRGNLHPMTLCEGPVEKIREETAAILQSGVKEGRRYVFCEGNNVAPNTPLAHFQAAYDAARDYGKH
jgi:uroporphyrinogen-III decarboxylase